MEEDMDHRIAAMPEHGPCLRNARTLPLHGHGLADLATRARALLSRTKPFPQRAWQTMHDQIELFEKLAEESPKLPHKSFICCLM